MARCMFDDRPCADYIYVTLPIPPFTQTCIMQRSGVKERT